MMKNFDEREQKFHERLTSIEVDVDQFKKKLNFDATTKTRKPSKLPQVAAAILILGLLSVGTAYAAADGFARIRSLFTTTLSDYVVWQDEPVYAEDQGIRISIYGVEQTSNAHILILTVQDVNGDLFTPYNWNPDFDSPITTRQGVLTPGYYVPGGTTYLDIDDMNELTSSGVMPGVWHFDLLVDGEIIELNPLIGSGRIVQFDETTRTAYLELIMLTNEVDFPTNENLALVARQVDISFFYNASHISDMPIFYNRQIDGWWQFDLTVNANNYQPLLWENVTLNLEEGNINFDYLRITPFSLTGAGIHNISAWNIPVWPAPYGHTSEFNLNIELEFANQRNIMIEPRPSNGLAHDEFMIHWVITPHIGSQLYDEYTDLPFNELVFIQADDSRQINIDDITAIIINGVRIPVE